MSEKSDHWYSEQFAIKRAKSQGGPAACERHYNNRSRAPTELDHTIGKRLRAQRELAETTLNALARRIGCSLQQLQKYEEGHNKIPASQLAKAAAALGVPIQCFFEGLPAEKAVANAGLVLPQLLQNDNVIPLLKAWARLRRRHQHSILNMLQSLGSPDDTAETEKS